MHAIIASYAYLRDSRCHGMILAVVYSRKALLGLHGIGVGVQTHTDLLKFHQKLAILHKNKMNTTATKEVKVAPPSPEEVEQKITRILAQTDWDKYWEDVSAGVAREVEAYDAARARSLANASRRFLR